MVSRIVVFSAILLVAVAISLVVSNYIFGDGRKPVLNNLVVDFGYIPDNFGDFLEEDFGTAGNSGMERPFLEFGYVASGPGGEQTLPTFEYRVRKDAKVYSPAAGYVVQLMYQPETDDYEIILSPSRNSRWFVSIDHVRNITVSEGDWVESGQPLGYPGPWDDSHGRVELMVGKYLGMKNIDYCPFELFNKSLAQQYMEKVERLMDYWNSINPGMEPYDTSYLPGCMEKAYVEEHGKGVVGVYK